MEGAFKIAHQSRHPGEGVVDGLQNLDNRCFGHGDVRELTLCVRLENLVALFDGLVFAGKILELGAASDPIQKCDGAAKALRTDRFQGERDGKPGLVVRGAHDVRDLPVGHVPRQVVMLRKQRTDIELNAQSLEIV